jgi:hypothetical protein
MASTLFGTGTPADDEQPPRDDGLPEPPPTEGPGLFGAGGDPAPAAAASPTPAPAAPDVRVETLDLRPRPGPGARSAAGAVDPRAGAADARAVDCRACGSAS